MHRSTVSAVLLVIGAGVALCPAEDLVLFRASDRGEGGWVPAGARITRKFGKLQISECSREGVTGSILLANNLPFFADGVITLDVFQVAAGSYTLQVLAVSKGGHIGTTDVVKDCTRTGPMTFPMKDLALPKQTEEILLKLWVGGMRGASMKLNELTYSVALDEDLFLMDERFAQSGAWKADNLVLQSGEGLGVAVLAPGARAGSLLCEKRLERQDFGTLILETPALEGGHLTLQAVLFDAQGNYLGSVEAFRTAAAGIHVVRADQIAWPADAERFMIKLWLSGPPGAKATLVRCLVMKRAAAPTIQ